MLKRSRWADLARRSQEIDRAVISAMLGTLIVLDGSGKIVALNRPPKSLPEGNAASLSAGARLGLSFLDACRRAAQQGATHARHVVAGLTSVLDRTAPQYVIEYKPDLSAKGPWYRLMASPIANNVAGAIIWETEIAGQDTQPAAGAAGSLAFPTPPLLPNLVEAIVSSLSVVGALITEVTDDGHQRGRILAASSSLASLVGESYELVGTASQQVLASGTSFIPSNAQSRFPGDPRLKTLRTESYLGVRLLDSSGQPIGSLETFHDRPMKDPTIGEAVLNLVGERAANELERLRVERQRLGLLQNLWYAERRYHALFDGMGDGVLVIDMDLRYVDCNDAALRFLGVAREQILGRRVGELSGRSLEEIKREVSVLHQKGEWSGEWRIARADGSVVWADVKSTEVELPQGPGYAAILHDITSRKQSEEALQTLEQMHSRVLGAIPDMMFRIAADGTYLDYTPAEGVDPLVPEPEFMGKTISEVMPPRVASQAMRSITEALRSGATQQLTYQLQIDGEFRDYEARIIPMDQEQILAVVRDYTAQRHQEQESHRQRQREELEGNAERLMLGRNAYLLTFREFTVLQLLSEGAPDKEIAERLAVSIFTVNKHVANILGKMRAASRTEAAVRAQREGLLA